MVKMIAFKICGFLGVLNKRILTILCLVVVYHGTIGAQEIEPLISKKGKLLFEDSFENSKPRPEWKALHGTQWKVTNGVFRGIPSTKEFQASRTNHTGATPSMMLEVAARDCILKMSVKISGDLDAAHIGFNEGSTQTTSGHIFRLILDVNKGIDLQKDRHSQIEGDKNVIMDHSDWKPKRDQWITVLIETKGEEVVAQIENGPTLIMKAPRLNVPKASGNLKARGGEGSISYDNVSIWNGLSL